VGAILPDALILAGLSWEESHRAGIRLYEAARVEREERGGDGNGFDPVCMARAAITHGASPRGLDYYADEAYVGAASVAPCPRSSVAARVPKEPSEDNGFAADPRVDEEADRGYAFQLGRRFSARAAEVCGVAPELGWWKAHNFVEMAVELMVASRDPDVGEELLKALRTPAVLRSAGAATARALELDEHRLVEGLGMLPRYLQLSPLSAGLLAEKYELQVRARHGVTRVDCLGVESLITECVEVVRCSVDSFFDSTVQPVKAVLEDHPV